MKILALEREMPEASAGDFRLLLKAEAAKVWDLYRQNVIRELYFNAEKHTAILLMECDDLQSARNYLEQLPLVQARLIDFDLIHLTPYDGFERLFSGANLD